MAWSEGVKTHFETEWTGDFDWDRGTKIDDHLFVTSINNGDYILVRGVDFGSGAKTVEANVSPIYGGKIEVRVEKLDGPVIATINVDSSREAGYWKSFSAPVDDVNGVHDVYFVFKGDKDLFNFDWWKFNR